MLNLDFENVFTKSIKCPKNSRKKVKNSTLSYGAHASTLLSVLYNHLLVLVPYFAIRSTPFAQIRKLKQDAMLRKEMFHETHDSSFTHYLCCAPVSSVFANSVRSAFDFI